MTLAVKVAVDTTRLLDPSADRAKLQRAGEDAARSMARRAAQGHAASMRAMGRLAAAEAYRDRIAGVVYTSVLDRDRCRPCARADDGVQRPLDDPVRLGRVPPNPDCEGAPFGNECRCTEVFVLAPGPERTSALSLASKGWKPEDHPRGTVA